jgi:hypothetical protein
MLSCLVFVLTAVVGSTVRAQAGPPSENPWPSLLIVGVLLYLLIRFVQKLWRAHKGRPADHRSPDPEPQASAPVHVQTTVKSAHAIFLSYRRDDTEGQAGRLYDDLVRAFGASEVFMDVDGIDPGVDFRKAIDEHLSSCRVFLSMIGPHWLEAKDEHGNRRLDASTDAVRLETAAALRRNIPVIPILVRGARVPKPEQLPDDLKDLAYRNGAELTHARWDSDVEVLIQKLQRLVTKAV